MLTYSKLLRHLLSKSVHVDVNKENKGVKSKILRNSSYMLHKLLTVSLTTVRKESISAIVFLQGMKLRIFIVKLRTEQKM